MRHARLFRYCISLAAAIGLVGVCGPLMAFAAEPSADLSTDGGGIPSLSASISNPTGDGATYRLTPLRVTFGAAPVSYPDLIADAAEASEVTLNLGGATYASSNDDVATIDGTGALVFVGVGVTNVVATLSGDQGTVTMLVNVNPLSLTNNPEASIAPIPDQNHTGSAVTPAFTVTVGNTTLVAGVDYTASYVANVDVGTATAIANGLGNYTGNVSTTFAIVEGGGQSGPSGPPVPEHPEMQRVYRLYNPNTGWHLYTESRNEYDELALIGWQQEGIAWYAPTSGPQIYRLYNPNAGFHFYTENAFERDQLVKLGWLAEGVAFHSAPSTGIPVYRLYNPGNGLHLFTMSANERDVLESLPYGAWNYEGIAWYGARVGAQPVG